MLMVDMFCDRVDRQNETYRGGTGEGRPLAEEESPQARNSERKIVDLEEYDQGCGRGNPKFKDMRWVSDKQMFTQLGLKVN